MKRVEAELIKLWEDKNFDESNISEIEEILAKEPSSVDIFVKKLDLESPAMSTLYLLVLNVIPLDICVNYALESEGWAIEDFSEFEWFISKDTFTPMSMNDYEEWLNNQIRII